MIIKSELENAEGCGVVCAIEQVRDGEVFYYIATDSDYIFRILTEDEVKNYCQILDDKFPATWVKGETSRGTIFSFPEMIEFEDMRYCLVGLIDDCKNQKDYKKIFRKRYREILEDYVRRTYGSEEKLYELIRKKRLEKNMKNHKERGWEMDEDIYIEDLEFLEIESVVLNKDDKGL